MEEKKSVSDTTNNDLAIVAAVPLANCENDSINAEKKNYKKKRSRSSGGFNFFKAATLIFRGKPSEKPKPPAIQLDVASNGNNAADNWKKIVGSIRPLHLQDAPSQSPPPQFIVNTDDDDQNQTVIEQFEDVIIAPFSPTPSSSSASAYSTSVYGSAMNLRELDDDDDDEDEDQVFDNKPADAMIDAKAEEFIAHFYAQMRRQQFDSAYRI